MSMTILWLLQTPFGQGQGQAPIYLIKMLYCTAGGIGLLSIIPASKPYMSWIGDNYISAAGPTATDPFRLRCWAIIDLINTALTLLLFCSTALPPHCSTWREKCTINHKIKNVPSGKKRYFPSPGHQQMECVSLLIRLPVGRATRDRAALAKPH